PVRGGHVGELNFAVFKMQFEALRDGDRFWYQRDLSEEDRERVESTRLSDIIRRNTDIGREIPDNVFRVDPPASEPPLPVVQDVNGDGQVDLSDPITVLGYLLLGSPETVPHDRADANRDGNVDLSDPITMLRALFGT
ncbi:MAG: peroxidase family protein, partial [Planctomycetota bacterium]